TYVLWIARFLAALSFGRSSSAARDWALQRQARRVKQPELIWDTDPVGEAVDTVIPEQDLHAPELEEQQELFAFHEEEADASWRADIERDLADIDEGPNHDGPTVRAAE
ncbi:MAG: hypothetical protein AAFY03_04990, partial [Pseudomonadota bacterium]